MNQYKLLTPGPLTTTDTVKKEMLFDHCTWDDDYKNITQKIRKQLLSLAHVSEDGYTAVLMQGSGTFGVEAVITSVVDVNGKLLIVANGAYGERMESIAIHANISYKIYREDYRKVPSAAVVERMLRDDPKITHVAMVHSETTSGILNDIASVASVVKGHEKTLILDAMSSFGGVDIQVGKLNIDFLISSANKCIQGVPGFSFIIADKKKLINSKGKARSLSLDLYEQWETMERDGKWRFTSPTHTVLAFAKALEELEAEGGIGKRSERYRENNRILIERFRALGMKPYIDGGNQGPIITTFYYPEDADFTFSEMYHYIKERGYAIYPGKVTEAETFRIGTIGEIYPEDIEKLSEIMEQFLKERKG